MGKKAKRQVRKSTPAVVSTPVVESVPTFKPVEKGFNPDYSLVIKDLRRIGILAGSFFLLLIALSFIIK